MTRLLAALLAVWPLAGQARFVQLNRELQTAHLRAAVLRSGHVIWKNGEISVAACEQPVIAERIPRKLLDTPAPEPPGATVRQVLNNTADGKPGEETLENPDFFNALKPIAGNAPLPGAVKFASVEHGPLGWFHQVYQREDVRWCHGPSVFIVQIQVPGEKRLTLVVSGDARLVDGNIVRSSVALAFFKDVAGLPVSERDTLIAHALTELSVGHRDAAASLVREALERFPELESTPDVSLLHLFSQLGLRETEASATAVIRDHPSLPTAWYYYGLYLENDKRYREAAACFHQILDHQPPWHHWTVAAAKKELATLE
jgi:hypothetical protein